MEELHGNDRASSPEEPHKDSVRVETADNIAVIRLDRPPLNVLNTHMRDMIGAAALRVGQDPRIRSVILYGGDRALAAGGDIHEMAEASSSEVDVLARRAHAAFSAVEAIRSPVVAALTGHTLGGGLELALCADYRICAASSVLGQPEVRLGLIPGGGGTQRLPRLIGLSRAKDLIYTGRQVHSAEALALGLVDEVVPDDEVFTRAREYAARLSSGSSSAIRAAKEAMSTRPRHDGHDGLEVERLLFSALFSGEDARYGLQHFREHGRPPTRFHSGRVEP
ncbi:enoyl-CoA hydratase/isomerase family protein [Streptomyces sp. NPDC054796]